MQSRSNLSIANPHPLDPQINKNPQTLAELHGGERGTIASPSHQASSTCTPPSLGASLASQNAPQWGPELGAGEVLRQAWPRCSTVDPASTPLTTPKAIGGRSQVTHLRAQPLTHLPKPDKTPAHICMRSMCAAHASLLILEGTTLLSNASYALLSGLGNASHSTASNQGPACTSLSALPLCTHTQFRHSWP